MKKIVKYILPSVLALSMCSCNDFFEMERPPQIPINNLEDLEMTAVAPYSALFYGGWGAFQSNNMLNEVLLADYFKWIGNVEDYPTEEIYLRRYNQRITQVSELYNKLYNAIGICNSGLYFYDSSDGNPLPYESEEDYELNIKRVKGELLFTRAYSYYYLVSIFCPPYNYGHDDEKILVKRTKMVQSSADALDNAPSPTSEIYDLIVSDLQEAIELLPEQWENGMHESYKSRGRANRWAAKALLGQVYFTMQRFKEAIAVYDDIIQNSGYDLVDNPFDLFNNQSVLPERAQNNEVIMWMFYADDDMNKTRHNSLRLCQFNKVKVDAQMGGNGPDATARVPNWSSHDWLQVCLSPSALVKMGWMNPDGSEPATALYDKRYYNQPADAGSYVNKEGLFYRFEGADPAKASGSKRSGASADGKYITIGKYAAYLGPEEPIVVVNKYFRTTDGRLQNQPLFRMGEIYLNRAAAKQKLGIAGWAADYNKVASRAWNAAAAGSAYVAKSDGEISQETIRIERWRELAGEDSWYMRYCAALGLEVVSGERTQAGEYSKIDASNFANAYWKNCIPLSGELDFRN